MEPLQAALVDKACAYPESIGQVDGCQDSPLEKLGRRVEVEGRKLEVEEESMTGWCQVRRKGGQVEKDVSAVSRGWEEYKKKFPHLAHVQRQLWSEDEWRSMKEGREWLEGGDELSMKEREKSLRLKATDAQKRKVETWLRGGGSEVEMFYQVVVIYLDILYCTRFFFKGKQSQ